MDNPLPSSSAVRFLHLPSMCWVPPVRRGWCWANASSGLAARVFLFCTDLQNVQCYTSSCIYSVPIFIVIYFWQCTKILKPNDKLKNACNVNIQQWKIFPGLLQAEKHWKSLYFFQSWIPFKGFCPCFWRSAPIAPSRLLSRWCFIHCNASKWKLIFACEWVVI